jgi:micrococcal nuclease
MPAPHKGDVHKMTRALVAIVVAAAGLFLLIVIAPFLLLGAVLAMLLAWKRPSTVQRVSSHPRLAPVPAVIRSTPMRFATSLVLVTTALTATSVLARPSEPGDISESRPAMAAPTVMASATADPTPSATARPRSTPKPTAQPTPTPTPTPVFGDAPTGPTERGTVVNVVDGDTIDVLIDGREIRVRLIGMDTPETHSGVEFLGPEASQALSDLVAGKDVVLEKDVSDTDRYGRALRYVWLEEDSGWLLVNLELIRLGFAQITTYPPDVKYVDQLYVPAQDAAQAEAIGVWAVAPTAAPVAPLPVAGSGCHGSYTGFCLTVGSGDWDCFGGSGDGPNYVPVTIHVVGSDEFGLDRDGDGLACD